MLGDGPKYLRPGSLVVDTREPARVLRVVRKKPPLPIYKRLVISPASWPNGRTKRVPGLKWYFVEDVITGAKAEIPGMLLQRTK